MPQERHALKQESGSEASQRKIEDRESENQRKETCEVERDKGTRKNDASTSEDNAMHRERHGLKQGRGDETRQRKEEKTSSGILMSRGEPEATADGKE